MVSQPGTGPAPVSGFSGRAAAFPQFSLAAGTGEWISPQDRELLLPNTQAWFALRSTGAQGWGKSTQVSYADLIHGVNAAAEVIFLQ